jgi:GT2 family glycosyltransferase/nucleoside-diphosphate-sugar epimerase
LSSFSVIIVSHFTGPILFATIKAVLGQRGLSQVILVNNGNRPDIVARLQQIALMEPKLSIISGQGNVGFAKAANLGAKSASGEILAFLRPDCLMPPQTLVYLQEGMSAIDGTMIMGGSLVGADGKRQQHQKPWQEKPLFDSNKPYETASIPSAMIAISHAHFKQLGGFDEGYFLHAADRDLLARARSIGGKIVHMPSIVLTNIEDFDASAVNGDSQWHKAKGMMRFYKKHFRLPYVPFAGWLMCGVALVHYALEVAFEDVQRWWLAGKHKQRTMASKRLMILASGLAELSETRELYGKTVLVTGATSEMGLCVMRRLIAAGASVLALSRGDAIPFEHEQLRWIKDDLDHKDCSLQGYAADMMVHCAPLAFLAPALDMVKNAGITRVIAFGSTRVFAKSVTKNTYEMQIISQLAKAERALEDALARGGIEWTLLRPTTTYGVGLDRGITRLYQWIRRFGLMPIYPPALGRRHPVHVDDLALAVMSCLHNANTFGKSYNLSGGEIVSYHDMLDRLFVLAQRKTRIIPWSLLPLVTSVVGLIMRLPSYNREAIYRMNEDQLFFHEVAKKDFGYDPRMFLSGGIRDMEGI